MTRKRTFQSNFWSMVSDDFAEARNILNEYRPITYLSNEEFDRCVVRSARERSIWGDNIERS